MALAHRLGDWQPRAQELLDRFDLANVCDHPVVRLSQGMRRKTALVMALLHRALRFVLDESFNGLDPLAQETLRRELLELRDGGATILLSTHRL